LSVAASKRIDVKVHDKIDRLMSYQITSNDAISNFIEFSTGSIHTLTLIT